MSIYKVDTESIIALSRLLHVGANAVDQTMRQSAAPALRKIVSSAAQMCSQQRSVWPTRSAA